MGKPISGILRCDALQSRSDGFDESGLGTHLGAAERAFGFAPHFFNGIELRRVGRQEEGLGSGAGRSTRELAHCCAGRSLSMTTTFPLAQGRAQNTAHIGKPRYRWLPRWSCRRAEPSRRIEQIMVVVCQRHGPYETENGYSFIYSALERRLLSSSQHGSMVNRTPPGHRPTARLSGASGSHLLKASSSATLPRCASIKLPVKGHHLQQQRA